MEFLTFNSMNPKESDTSSKVNPKVKKVKAKKRDSGSKVNSCPLSSHEIDGVRKEKERLTASKLGNL